MKTETVMTLNNNGFKLTTNLRWLKVFNISLASERKQRNLAHETTGDNNLTAEMHPFAFSSSGKGPDEFRETPFVYVPNLVAKVADTLSQHQRYKSNYI